MSAVRLNKGLYSEQTHLYGGQTGANNGALSHRPLRSGSGPPCRPFGRRSAFQHVSMGPSPLWHLVVFEALTWESRPSCSLEQRAGRMGGCQEGSRAVRLCWDEEYEQFDKTDTEREGRQQRPRRRTRCGDEEAGAGPRHWDPSSIADPSRFSDVSSLWASPFTVKRCLRRISDIWEMCCFSSDFAMRKVMLV